MRVPVIAKWLGALGAPFGRMPCAVIAQIGAKMVGVIGRAGIVGFGWHSVTVGIGWLWACLHSYVALRRRFSCLAKSL